MFVQPNRRGINSLEKPHARHNEIQFIEELMEHKTQQAEDKKTGSSNDYRLLAEQVCRAAGSSRSARLAKDAQGCCDIGEAGVGKGAIAKNIYFQSKTGIKEQPFMSINLSVLDDKELESVLFGFDRGVEGLPYTSKRGLFELANGGTVLIEEIEERASAIR